MKSLDVKRIERMRLKKSKLNKELQAKRRLEMGEEAYLAHMREISARGWKKSKEVREQRKRERGQE